MSKLPTSPLPFRTYRLKLRPEPEEQLRLEAILESFTRDCAHLHAVALKHGIWHPLRLQVLAYKELATRPADQAPLPSQYIIRAIDRVAQQIRATKAKPPRRNPFPPQSFDLDARCCSFDAPTLSLRIQSMESKGVEPWLARSFRLTLPLDFPDAATRESFSKERFLGGTLIVLTDGRPSILVARMAPPEPVAAVPEPVARKSKTTIINKITVKFRDVENVTFNEPRPRRPRAAPKPRSKPAPPGKSAPPPAPRPDPPPWNRPSWTAEGLAVAQPQDPGPGVLLAPAGPRTTPARWHWLPVEPGAYLCLVTALPEGSGLAAPATGPGLLTGGFLASPKRSRSRKPPAAPAQMQIMPAGPGHLPPTGLLR